MCLLFTNSAPPRLYDLALQGIPEMVFLGPRRRKLVAPLTGLILEVGAGTGFALKHYSTHAHLVATEPDIANLERLAMRAREATATVVVACADAMNLPFPNATFDGLVCQLALCTIPDPQAALREAQRVLKPNAPARFLEHVRAGGPARAKLQDLIAPAWKRLAGGCRLNQETVRLIRESGLRVERVEGKAGLLLPMKLVWACNGES